MNRPLRVVHIIPAKGIGGVEIAANSIVKSTAADVDFRLAFIAGESADIDASDAWSINTPPAYWRLVREILSSPPDIIIASLWRSAIVGILVKLCRPSTKVVCFLHADKRVHFLDYLFNSLLLRMSSGIWTDSTATLGGRVPRYLQGKATVISFVVERYLPVTATEPLPRFIFWGRMRPQKGLVDAVRLFGAIAARVPTARFSLVGPDGGCLTEVKDEIRERGLSNKVQLYGPLGFDQITSLAASHSFYLQTSLFEGMAMSVVEAMQLGLVPVVTSVGEIRNYCVDRENAVIVRDTSTAVAAVQRLLDNSDEYQKIRSQAIACWQGRDLYRESVIRACLALAN